MDNATSTSSSPRKLAGGLKKFAAVFGFAPLSGDGIDAFLCRWEGKLYYADDIELAMAEVIQERVAETYPLELAESTKPNSSWFFVLR